MNVTRKQQPLLHLGSTGKRVRTLETRLKKLGLLKGAVDATFDDRTAAAVVKYKKAHGWNPRPVVGARMTKSLKQAADGFHEGKTPSTLKGATYNCEIHRNPANVAKWLGHYVHANKIDFVQLQEISGYDQVLKKIPGYELITFPKSKDHGETGVLVRKGLEVMRPQSIQSTEGWINVHKRPAQPRAATAVRVAGWLEVVSVHAPPGIDWKNGHAVGPEQRIKSYGSLTDKLRRFANRHARRHPGEAILIGGDWNEGARTGGKWSPSWLASKAGLKKHPNHRIDWEMSRGARVENIQTGPDGGSDHHIVTFTVHRPGKKKD